jgi:hypothetical protein
MGHPETASSEPQEVGYGGLSKLNGWSWGIEGLLMPDDNGFVGVVSFEEGVTGLQMAKVFVLYIENHPEEENKPAHLALMRSMLDAKLVTVASPGKDAPK